MIEEFRPDEELCFDLFSVETVKKVDIVSNGGHVRKHYLKVFLKSGNVALKEYNSIGMRDEYYNRMQTLRKCSSKMDFMSI